MTPSMVDEQTFQYVGNIRNPCFMCWTRENVT